MDKRLLDLRTFIKRQNLDALLVSSVPNIIYLTSYCAFSYFEREAFLIISKNENYLITDGRYSEAVSKIPGFTLLEISNKNSIDDIFKSLPKINRLGIEDENISLSEGKKLKKYFKIVPMRELKNLRIVKEENEISKIRRACEIGDKAFKYILSKIKKGVSEKEIAFEIELFIKKAGADIAFPSIVAFGANSSIPHHQTSNQRLKINGQILLDFGVKFENYYSDMTRTIFFGKADEKFKKIYNTVLESQQKAIDYLSSSFYPRSSADKKVKASNVDRVAREHITDNDFPTIPHSLGHGIGIEVHEAPRLSPKSKDILRPGMVFSVEPGVYIPNFGGVRIEDLVLIRENKLEILTHSPKEIIEL
ncbi:MAG: Xaa-Pro peptidase family protein [Patescibacteria group bacterium]|nr:Xaa-Pro peptidase family protein [Patescibacteria group bacterium]